MLASLLNKQIVIERESTTVNRVGTGQKAYVFHKECWAQKVVTGGTMQYQVEGELPFTTDDFIIRYDETVDYKCRVIYNNDYYKIERVEEIGRRQWLKLKCIVWEKATTY